MSWKPEHQKPIEILIAIQARSNSSRFPKKIYEHIGDRRVLDHVISMSNSTAAHIHKYSRVVRMNCRVAVLHPETDNELVRSFRSSNAIFIAGSEEDVLSRYIAAQRMTDADYVVRLTSDCPLILDYVIAKHINVAVINQHDYVSNIEESCRFVADGFDCEVISRKALDWLSRNARDAEDREHVTTAIRRHRPPTLSQAFIASKLDTSRMKMSVDTKEDLDRMREYYHEREHKMTVARRLFGSAVYEL